ncbi:hypothetical protein LPB86_18070 [Pedobacter sp. MC2016-14]|uniref:hypothetical protein n=1 Tax=Pedobacter sp. MC2016-14 TaxID=2897327 RepID=UPI001E3D37C2|nr:hypothetical protein [Pedobacter sp. MC2016-14]MCD0490153.1 hypothetical protein [Pedobacter sp. MC2016-14]
MKTSKKFLATALLLGVMGSVNVHAQTVEPLKEGKGFRIGIGASGGLTSDSSPFDYGLGADARIQWDLSNYVSVLGTGGYTRMFGKDANADYDFIPAKGGVKVFPIGNMYALGEIGAGFAIKDGSKTSLIWSGGVGYECKNGLDFSFRYEGYTQDSSSSTYVPYTGQYALRIAYGFKL